MHDRLNFDLELQNALVNTLSNAVGTDGYHHTIHRPTQSRQEIDSPKHRKVEHGIRLEFPIVQEPNELEIG